MSVDLLPDSRGYIYELIAGIVESGWALAAVPKGGRLLPNRQPILLRIDGQTRELRLHVYKIGGSSRNRPDERRIEITTTYDKGGADQPTSGNYEDVVLGYDPDTRVFVGFDHRRLFEGGASHNASSFFDGAALAIPKDALEVVPFESALFGVEHHVFFSKTRAADYLLHARQLHASGTLASSASSYRRPAGTTTRMSVDHQSAVGEAVHLTANTALSAQTIERTRQIEQLESGISARKMSPRALDIVLARCQENGRLGEQFVHAAELQRLRGLGRSDLAERVSWVSLANVAAGFDILVPEEDGQDHFVEVKATQGTSMTFPMSEGEWRKAQQVGDRYWIARVTSVRSEDPHLTWWRNPVAMEAAGELVRGCNGFQVTVEGW
jgi:hypothetical protein